jgi:hypothetical protein
VQVFFLSVVLASALVTPMVFLGNASGHDFQPHLASWLEVAAQWREGTFYPSWAGGANFGFGEPRFIFYPPASWIIGAALGSVLPWRMVPGTFIWLAVLAGCLSMWYFAREWLSQSQVLVASLLFVANPYSLAVIYYRSDFAEFLASSLFPLLVWGTIGVVQGNWRRVPVLSFVVAGIWLTNAPAAVIATYSMVLILLVGCVIRGTFKGALFGALGLLGGLLVAAFYVIPAWWEQRFVQVGTVGDINYLPENNFLFTHLNDPDYALFNWKISAIALTLIILTGVGITLCLRQRSGRSEPWWMLVSLYCAAVFLLFPFSTYLWRYLPEMRFLQFPWRWLLAVNVCFAFFGGLSGRSWWALTAWTTLLLVVLATAVTMAGDTNWDSDDLNEIISAVGAGRGYEGIQGFEPRGAGTDDLDSNAKLISEYDAASGDVYDLEQARVDIKQWLPEWKSFETTSTEPVSIAPKLLNYPAW